MNSFTYTGEEKLPDCEISQKQSIFEKCFIQKL